MTRRSSIVGWLILGAIALSLGCTASSPAPAPVVPDPALQVQDQEAGTLMVRVKWPKLDLPGFSAQLIPQRTRSIRLSAGNPDGKSAEMLLQRPSPSTVEATASFRLLAGANYTLTARAFAEANPGVSAVPIAIGNATNVTIWKSTITQVPLTLTALYAPSISAFSPTYGSPGTLVRVTGRGFGHTQNMSWSIRMAGTDMTGTATRSSDTTLDFAVPQLPDKTVANLEIVVDGVPSTTVALFTIGPAGLEPTLFWPDTAANGLGLTLDGHAGNSSGMGVELGQDGGQSAGALFTVQPAPTASPPGLTVHLGAATESSTALDITLAPASPAPGSGFALTID